MARPDDPDVHLLRALRAADSENAAAIQAAQDRIEGLRAAGFRIAGDPGSGWRLLGSPAALIADDVLATFPETPGRTIAREILVFEETDSTNDVAARAGDDGAAGGLVIFAEKQRAGRGRLGRTWESRPGLGLWFSVLLRPATVPVERWPELTFCAALAVAETAELHTGQPARIKWPNDVYVNDRKIAGILLECHHRQSPGYVVVGIGVNVLQAETDFDPALRHRAGSLEMVCSQNGRKHFERRLIAASLLEKLDEHYCEWPEHFPNIMKSCEDFGCMQPTSEE